MLKSPIEWSQIPNISSMYLYQTIGAKFVRERRRSSQIARYKLAIEGANLCPMATPLTCKYIELLNVKSLPNKMIFNKLRMTESGLAEFGKRAKIVLREDIAPSIWECWCTVVQHRKRIESNCH